ncbi:MAG: CotH kinase family protein [bacterium]|nr:CotH kinase family protein [bacterium]
MVKSKTVNLICCICLGVMLILAVVVWVSKAAEGRQKTVEMGYESLFDKSYVHTINIEIDDWEQFIETATNEEYVTCDVVIDGQKIRNVGIRAKGNTSLSSVASQGSEKYSLKIEFDHFVDGKLYNGLDKLSLNNLIYDATMMKDYLAYTLMGEMDVPSPLCSYVEISVNGEAWGLYLAVEGVEDSFMERNNMTRGELYKPDSMSFGGGRGNGREFDFEQFRVDDDESTISDQSAAQPAAQTDATQSFSGADFSAFSGFSGTSMPSGMSFPGGIMSGMSMPSGDMSSGTMPSGSMPSGSMPSGGQMPSGTMPTGNMPSGGQMPSDMSMFSGNMPSDVNVSDFAGMTPPSGDFSSSDSSSSGFPGAGGMGGFSIAGFAGNFNFGMGSSDVKLQYIDDDVDSYSNIFNNAKTKLSKTDKKRLINALKKLSSGEDIENVVFTDEVINYLAVHDFLQNSDSYTGMMVHNYYLYEEDGQFAIIPWDYNLAFGGMNGSDGTSLVNSPIDTPVTNGSTSDRPLIGWIFEDEQALEQYHETYSRFISEYIESGWLEKEIARVAEIIRPYVEKDENSFYSAEEFDQAVATLQSYCTLRGQSIRGQLDGTIPSTSNGQRSASASLVDASGLNVSSMGSMGGTGGGGFGGGFGGGNSFSIGSFDPTSSGRPSSDRSSSGRSFPSSSSSGQHTSQQTAQQPMQQSAQATDGQPAQMTAEQPPQMSSQPASEQSSGTEGQRTMPSGMDFGKSFSMPQGFGSSQSKSENWILIGIYVLVLLVAIGIVMLVRKHNE